MPLFYRVLVGLNLFFAAALVLAVFLPLRQSVALRWGIEINDWTASFELLAALAADCSVIASFWPLRAHCVDVQIPLGRSVHCSGC